MDNITGLYKRLEPLIRKTIRDMLGEGIKGNVDDGFTWIHGTKWAKEDGTGNRGADVVDLQLTGTDSNDVAGSDYSGILTGNYNKIVAGSDYSVVLGGAGVDMGQYSYLCLGYGFAIDIDVAGAYSGGQYAVVAFGENHDIEEGNYIFIFGTNNDIIDETFGGYSVGENNDLTATGVSDYPTYTGQYAAINCLTQGDVWSSLQVGEQNDLLGSGASPTQWIMQFGYRHYTDYQLGGLHIGEETISNDDSGNGYFNGRIVWGNGVNSYNAGADPYQGMNQCSLISQEELIASWSSSWVTGYQYPLIENTLWYFEALIAGAENVLADFYAWKLEGVIANTQGTMNIVTQTLTKVYPTDNTKEWQAEIDNANKRLLIQYRDTAGTDNNACNVQIQVRTVEVGKASAVGSPKLLYVNDGITLGESVTVNIV